jgi:hypothetical protein
MDPDLDPAIFVSDFQNVLFAGTFTSYFKDKSHKKSQNSRNQCFSYFFA